MAHKVVSIDNLYKDLGYIIHLTVVTDFMLKTLPLKEGMMVLEAGSGSGKLGISYAARGCRVHMIDVDIDAIEYGRRLRTAYMSIAGMLKHPHADFAVFNQVDLFSRHYADDVFDLVFNEGVVQHFPEDPERQQAIDSMVRVCKPGGNVCIIGNNGSLAYEQKLDREVEFTYEGMPPKRRCFTLHEMAERLERAGLVDIQVGPVQEEAMKYGDFMYGDNSILIAGWGRKP